MSDNSSSSSGISAVSLLGVAFVILKLCGVIDWSWWWVTLPFWAGIALVLVGGAIYLLIYLLIALPVKHFINQRKKKRDEYWKEIEDIQENQSLGTEQSKFMRRLNEVMEANKIARKEAKK